MMWRIDTKKWFNASVDACLLYLDIKPGERNYRTAVFSSLTAPEPELVLDIQQGTFVRNIDQYHETRFLDGTSPITWRQGLKHDAASVMELTYAEQTWTNKFSIHVDIEPERVYPLLKSTDLYHGRTQKLKRGVIVPQFSLGEDTSSLQIETPKLWAYLQHYRPIFEQRKSSVYRNKPPFSIFGVGDYTFAPYKVAVSGLHKVPRFRLIAPIHDKPVILDDSCYFVACQTNIQAALLVALLEHSLTQAFIKTISFVDSKRPITKKVLQRINLAALLKHIELPLLFSQAQQVLCDLNTSTQITEEEWRQGLESLFVSYSKHTSLFQASFDL